MTEGSKELLYNGAKSLGVTLSDEIIEMFAVYGEMLKERNKSVNLTAITEDNDIAVKHFVDSLTLCPLLSETKARSLIDIGTGAGFPGIPVKLVCPEIKVTLVDSLEKRVKFLNDVIAELKLEGIEAIHSRAEDIGRDNKHREKYDFATARAVSSIPVLLEYCMPLLKVKGHFAALKGSKEEEEYDRALEILGGRFVNKSKFALNSNSEVINRIIYMFRKEKNTSTNYPRKSGLPAKKPLL